MRDKIRRGLQGSIKTLQALFGYPARIECPVKDAPISVRSEEFQICLADDDIIRRCVVVHFLVPFLHKGAADLLDVVTVHDLEYLITDPLPLATPAQCSQHEPDQLTAGWLVSIYVGQS